VDITGKQKKTTVSKDNLFVPEDNITFSSEQDYAILLKTMLTRSSHGLVLENCRRNTFSTNQYFYKMFDIDYDSIAWMSDTLDHLELIRGLVKNFNIFYNNINRAIERGEPVSGIKATLNDGRNISLAITPLINKQNLCFARIWQFDIAGINNDEAENQFKHNRYLKALFNSSTDAIIFFNSEYKVIDINKNFTSLFGHKLERIKGLDVDSTLELGKAGSANYSYTRKVLAGKTVVTDGTRYRSDGEPIEVSIKGIPVTGDNGELIGGYAIYSDISGQKKASQALQYKLEFENMVTDISAHFVSAQSSEFDNAVEFALRKSGAFFKVDRSYMFLISEDRNYLCNTHEWCADGIKPQIDVNQNLPLSNFKWLQKQLKKNWYVSISDVNTLPVEAALEKAEFTKQDIKSVLLVPFIVDNQPVGFFGYDSVREHKTWTEEQISLLKIVAEIISSAYIRNQAEEAIQQRDKQLDALFNNLPGMIYRCENDQAWTMKYVSSFCRQLTGYDPHDLINNNTVSYKALVLPEFRDELWKKWQSALAQKELYEGEYQIKTASGDIKWVWEKGVGVHDDSDNLLYLEGYITDVTIKKKAEEMLKQSEEKFRQILSAIEEGYFEVNLEGEITYCNEAAAKILGYMADEFIGLPYHSFCKDPEAIYQSFNQLFTNGYFKQPLVAEMIKKDGSEIYIELSLSLIKDKEERTTGFRGIGRDFSERKSFEDQLKYLSLHDQLTALYNRFFFENAIKRLDRSREHPISLISIDLDGLKLVNDTVGHERGDKLLIACAAVLRQALRTADILARVGGDEFVALLPRTDSKTGELIIKRIHEKVSEYNSKQMSEIPLSISMGIATSQSGVQPLEFTFREADDLMYREKLHKGVDARSQILQSLMAALGERDYITTGHALRLEKLCLKMTEHLDLSKKQISNLVLLAQVHDLGKVGIPDHILYKEVALTISEWEVMNQHSEKGYRIALASTDLSGIADLILKHHERWDGTGYPLGLKEKEIPIECRILAIADAYDAMTNDRPYRKAMDSKNAIDEIKKNAGTQFDPQLADLFILLYKNGSI